jgi:hypothetical protein
MAKIYLFIGVLSLSAFAWAQYRGIGLFDDTVDSSHAHSSSGGRSGHRTTFHK